MAWVVDTCILLDLRIGHPQFALPSAECLERHAADGLLVAPLTFIELAPAFHGDLAAERRWLDQLGIACREPWLEADTEAAHHLWSDFIQRKRLGQLAKRPLADVLIAAFALRFAGLITRNERHFLAVAPELKLIAPTRA